MNFFSNPYLIGAVALTVVLQLLVIYVPFLQAIFATRPLSAPDLLLTIGASLFVLVAVEIWKVGWRWRSAQAKAHP